MRNMLITIFDGVMDPRKTDQCTYEPGDLMAIALLTYLCGGEDYPDMAMFAEHRSGEFGLLPYTDRNPSRDTFERLFAALGTDYVRQCVVGHGKRIMDVMNEKQIAIDTCHSENA